jgi:diguanylate cyclase (GGDEF)-like protein
MKGDSMSDREILNLFGGELEDQAELYEKVQDLEKQLEDARAEVAMLSRDCVTGLATRHTFETHLRGMFSNNRKGDQALGIVMCDIDHFKTINDQYGHRIGDEVISRVAAAVQSCTRNTDIAARYGGEEFVCILVNAEIQGAAVMCERIRQEVAQVRVKVDEDTEISVTISLGFALQDVDDISGWDIVKHADQALYRAKNKGRNRVEGQYWNFDEVQQMVTLERIKQHVFGRGRD